MKYISKYVNNAAYLAAKGNAASFLRPHVSLLKDSMEVRYDDILPRIGDYLFSDLTYGSTVFTGKTPIAICVAPASHFSDGKNRWMSLVNMSATDPENGTTATGNNSFTNPGAGFCWGYNQVAVGNIDDKAPRYDGTEFAENDELVLSQEGGTGYGMLQMSSVPEGQEFHFDEEVRIYYGYKLIPGFTDRYMYVNGDLDMPLVVGPLNPDGTLNSNYNQYAFTEVDGSLLTEAIIAEATKYSTGEITRNDYGEGSYPAAMACHRFFTAGTQAGDWYLPSIAELSYLVASLVDINTKLMALSTDAVAVGNYSTSGTLGSWLWSSSEGSDIYAWRLDTYYGYIDSYIKDNNASEYRVRAFLAY